MMPDSILYYPHIEFQNEAWVKSSLLLWNHVYRIVPEGYRPKDSDEIKVLVDADLVRNIRLNDEDRGQTVDEFLSLCDRLEENMPAGLIPSDEDRIHPDKIDKRLYPYLDLIGEYFIDEDRWLHLSKELARGYMFKLSQVVARMRHLNRGTDDLDAWSISPFFCENANFGEFLRDKDASGFFCSVTLEDVVPENIGDVSARNIISFVNNRRDERSQLREKFYEFTSNLSMISNAEHAAQVGDDFIKDLMISKEEYRKSMDNWKDIPALAISTGGPVSMTALGMLSAIKGNPFSLLRIAGSLVMGAICSYADYRKTKKRRDPSYSSYLIGIDKLCNNVTGESYTRLEEFIND